MRRGIVLLALLLSGCRHGFWDYAAVLVQPEPTCKQLPQLCTESEECRKEVKAWRCMAKKIS
jgi:hypothetical protein